MSLFFGTYKRIILLCAAVLFAVGLSGCAGADEGMSAMPVVETVEAEAPAEAETEEASAPVLSLVALEEQGEDMRVSTSWCDVKYPTAFADVIRVEAVSENNVAELRFHAVIQGAEYAAFSLVFGGEGDMPVGALVLPNGETVTVGVRMHPTPEELDENNQITFFATQEMFNDVEASLRENTGYTPAV